MKSILALSAAVILCSATPASAAVYSDALGKCLVTNTSKEDKVILIKWIFASMTLNPDVASLTAVSDEQRDAIFKDAGQMVERLMTVACRKEASEALRYEGDAAIQSAFQLLGQVAGIAMMSNPAVANGSAKMTKYLDEKKFRELLEESK